MHGNQFVVRFKSEVTPKGEKRIHLDEVGLHTDVRLVAYFAVAAALFGLPSGATAQQNRGEETFSVVTTVETPSKSTLNGFDISYADPTLGEHFLSDSTDKAILAINVFTKTPTLLGTTAVIDSRKRHLSTTTPATETANR